MLPAAAKSIGWPPPAAPFPKMYASLAFFHPEKCRNAIYSHPVRDAPPGWRARAEGWLRGRGEGGQRLGIVARRAYHRPRGSARPPKLLPRVSTGAAAGVRVGPPTKKRLGCSGDCEATSGGREINGRRSGDGAAMPLRSAGREARCRGVVARLAGTASSSPPPPLSREKWRPAGAASGPPKGALRKGGPGEGKNR